MTERELFDALGKVSVGHVQRALDSECPTRAQRMQRHFGNVFQNLGTDNRVLFNVIEFRRRQFSGLMDDIIGHTDFTDIV